MDEDNVVDDVLFLSVLLILWMQVWEKIVLPRCIEYCPHGYPIIRGRVLAFFI
jgi:hypothetical protein